MSKKNEQNSTEVTERRALEPLMVEHPNVTLAKLANALGAPYAVVRAKARQPIEGAVYNPEAVNFGALETYLFKRDPELNLESLDWETMNDKSQSVATTKKAEELDLKVGNKYYLRYFKSNWSVVYITETHVCIVSEDPSNTQPKVLAKSTFANCGVKDAE